MAEASVEDETPPEGTQEAPTPEATPACDDDDASDVGDAAVTPVRPARTPDRRTPRTPRVKDDVVRETSPVAATIACRRAKFDFAGENDDELSFRAGEVVRILDKRPGDWWFGETCNGHKGIFPCDYIDANDGLVEVLES